LGLPPEAVIEEIAKSGLRGRGGDRAVSLDLDPALDAVAAVHVHPFVLDAVEALLDTKIEALEAGLLLQQLTGVDFKPVEIAP